MRHHYDGEVWVQIERAEDLPGVWIAHCLDFDLVTQGSSIKHAVDMAYEAITMVVEEDLMAGRDLADRRASKEDRDFFYRLLLAAEKMPPGAPFPLDDSQVAYFLVMLRIEVECDDGRTEHQVHDAGWMPPIALSVPEMQAA